MKQPRLKLRRVILAVIFLGILSLIAGAAGVSSFAVVHTEKKTPVPVAVNPLAKIIRVPYHNPTPLPQTQVPVLLYHELDNDCPAAAAICKSHDYESVSLTQFKNEMGWMYSHGYHTVTLDQYLQWLANPGTLLPPKPFLITVDNGIWNFLSGAEPVLYHYRYTAAVFLVTGFADAATGQCSPRILGVNVQPGCPKINETWDATWDQIRSLSPEVYSFGIEAGQDAHFEQDYAKNCFAFNACKLPAENNTAYEHRVLTEYDNGITELTRELGSRFNSNAWVVPYSDLGYPCSKIYGCAYENYTGPKGWLIAFAKVNFQAAFVQDQYRNGIDHERFRFEIHGNTTLGMFTKAIRGYLASGSWERG